MVRVEVALMEEVVVDVGCRREVHRNYHMGKRDCN
jgi:hypothetical protein